jgi:hypothetical protein
MSAMAQASLMKARTSSLIGGQMARPLGNATSLNLVTIRRLLLA